MSAAVLTDFIERNSVRLENRSWNNVFSNRETWMWNFTPFWNPRFLFYQVHIFVCCFRRRARHQKDHAWSSSGKTQAHFYLRT